MIPHKKMSEADVLYSDVRFTRVGGNTKSVVPSAEDTYSEVKITKPVEQRGSKQSAESHPQPRLTSERVALLVVTLLLAAAITALCVTLYLNVPNKQTLQNPSTSATALHRDTPCPVEESSESQKDKAPPKCPKPWEQHGGKCYYFTTTPLNWNQSREVCKAVGGDLVMIDSRQEQMFLESKLREKMEAPEDKFWIGLTDWKTEGEWIWVDGTRLNPWLRFWLNEPDDWKTEDPAGEDCVRMGEKSGAKDLKCWGDKSCRAAQKSICEKQEVDGLCP